MRSEDGLPSFEHGVLTELDGFIHKQPCSVSRQLCFVSVLYLPSFSVIDQHALHSGDSLFIHHDIAFVVLPDLYLFPVLFVHPALPFQSPSNASYLNFVRGEEVECEVDLSISNDAVFLDFVRLC